MSLTPGTRLGPYEVTAQIGVGGMGEVYRATDTNLKRAVAIKVLPDALASDAERLARFQREAEVLASLSHPNIAAVYGLERSAGTTALVMELVEGPTLAERIAQGPIPVDDALPIAGQIADALEAAHEQGIIHRDLKPANIKIRPDGSVKVLDFGLAKLVDSPGAASTSTISPTITSPALMTGVGVLLGTAAYMSPEQAKGRAADKRSDIWSFGCVLYEMLTGRRPFDGEDVSDTLASVLKSDPDWTLLPSDVPPSIRRIVERCMTKDRRRRVADIAVVQFVLTDAPGLAAADAPNHTGIEPRAVRQRVALAALAGVVVASMVASAAWWLIRPRLAPNVTRFSVRLAEGQTFSYAGRQVVTISPDGTQIVFSANDQLFLRSLNDLDAHAIRGSTGGPVNPTFSPDGRSIAFFSSSESVLKRIPASGGVATTVAKIENPFGMSWDEDGIVIGAGRGGIDRVSSNSGTPQRIVSVAGDEWAYGPQILPGGRAILFTLAKLSGNDRPEAWDDAQIVVQSLTSGTRTIITHGSDARYLPSGHLLYTRGGIVYAVAFDPQSAKASDEAIPVIEGVRRAGGGVTAAAQLSVARTGSLVYVPGPSAGPTNARSLVVSDRNGAITPISLPAGPYIRPRASPDGARVVLARDDEREADIWIIDVAGQTAPRKLTFGGHSRFPIWSPDGTIAFQSQRDDTRPIFVLPADGSASPQALTTPAAGEWHRPESFSRDGKQLLFSVLKNATHSLWLLTLENKKTTAYGDVRSREPLEATFSPDGRWVAYAGGPVSGAYSSERGVYVQPFPATGAKYQAPKARIDYHPAWSRDGKELFYVAALGYPLVAVPVLRTQPEIAFGSPVPMQNMPRPAVTSGGLRGYDIVADGRFVSLVPAADNPRTPDALSSELRVVVHWFEELNRLVPTN